MTTKLIDKPDNALETYKGGWRNIYIEKDTGKSFRGHTVKPTEAEAKEVSNNFFADVENPLYHTNPNMIYSNGEKPRPGHELWACRRAPGSSSSLPNWIKPKSNLYAIQIPSN